MTNDIFSRNELIWGEDFQKSLSQVCVMVAGLGGVGGYALESLARAGVGKFIIIDFDTVETSNINRQIIAANSTVGQHKTDLFEARLKDINPDIKVEKFNEFYKKELNDIILKDADFVVDAIDTMRYKVDLIESCVKRKIPIISAFGAGNRLDPTKLKIVDISEIDRPNCTFSKNILYQLKKRKITSGVKAVVSEEIPIKSVQKTVEKLSDGSNKIQVGSCVFVPAVMGYYMGYYVINNLKIGLDNPTF